MKIVINISSTLKKIADDEEMDIFRHIGWQQLLMDAIREGTVLPEGHGRLIDADALLKHRDGGDWNGVCCDPEYVKTRYISSAPTIIEADNAESDE